LINHLWILGGGGHAKVVIDTAFATGLFRPVGVLDDDPGRLGAEVLGVPVRGAIDLATIERLGVEHAVLAIGNNRVRAELAARLDGRVTWVTLVHPSAVVAPSARIGEGSVTFAGGVIQPDAVIGRHAIVNTAASIDHDCEIGDFAHIAPGVHLAGNVYVGAGAFLGIGSCAIPGSRIGEWATVGAGGVVIDDIPPGEIAKGVPARWTPRQVKQ
jgi:sugar O-acyltransferase (sialic acid O-acetyltransferase NeuD family)